MKFSWSFPVHTADYHQWVVDTAGSAKTVPESCAVGISVEDLVKISKLFGGSSSLRASAWRHCLLLSLLKACLCN
jgi:hypothetical protein